MHNKISLHSYNEVEKYAKKLHLFHIKVILEHPQ